MVKSSPTRIFLHLFILSVVVNAVLGIWALLAGDFGETQGKVVLTSFVVSAAMLSVLVNAPAMRRRCLWPLPVIGAATGAGGFALFIVVIWIGDAGPGDSWIKLTFSALVVAAAATLASALALIALADRYRLLQPVAQGLIAALGVSTLIAIWVEPDMDWYARLIGVISVLVAAVTLLIPVVSRFGSGGPGAGPRTDEIGDHSVRYCPSCGREVEHRALGPSEVNICRNCGLRFQVINQVIKVSETERT
jgi:hypothetical protein